METYPQEKDKKIAPVVDAIVPEQNAHGEHDVPAETVGPTVEKNLPVRLPEETAKAAAPADGYEQPVEDIAKEELWQAATDFLPDPAADDARIDELNMAPQAVLLDERASADGYTEDSAEQTSQGGLTEEYFSRSAEVNEEVPTDRIQHFLGIPDYLTQTISADPILARIVDDFFCIEGWDLVEDAKMRQQELLSSRVKYRRLPAGADLETELAILKSAARMGSEGGHASYAEKIANTKRLYSRLRSSTANPLIYRRGGARTKGQTGNTRAENIRWVIQNRVGQDQDTVTTHLHHGRHLSEDALKYLVAGGATKRFFETVQTPKTKLIVKLEGHDPTPDEMTALVSELLLSLFKAFQSKGGKFEKDTIKNVVDQFNQTHFSGEREAAQAPISEAPAEQQDRVEMTPHSPGETGNTAQTQSKTEMEDEAKSSDEPTDKFRQARKIVSPIETKKEALTVALAAFLDDVTDISDQKGIIAVAHGILEYGYQLCAELLSSEELQAKIETLGADARG